MIRCTTRTSALCNFSSCSGLMDGISGLYLQQLFYGILNLMAVHRVGRERRRRNIRGKSVVTVVLFYVFIQGTQNFYTPPTPSSMINRFGELLPHVVGQMTSDRPNKLYPPIFSSSCCVSSIFKYCSVPFFHPNGEL